jgi:hypothetical protein
VDCSNVLVKDLKGQVANSGINNWHPPHMNAFKFKYEVMKPLPEFYTLKALLHTLACVVLATTNSILWQIVQLFFPSFLHPHSQVGQQQFVYCEKQTIYGL